MGIDKNKSINEYIGRLKYLSGYKLNEAKYSLVKNLEEDDDIPEEIWTSPSPSKIIDEDEPTSEMGGDEPVEEPVSPGMGSEQPMNQPQQQSVNQIQNDIIKASLSTMQKMNDQLNTLEMTISNMNQQMGSLNKEVKEVREPTNVEKLVARKQDSHPFYLNLNDMWNDNSFQARSEMEDSHGIKKLDDGTYVADFDTLPKYSEQEIKDSFNEGKIIKNKNYGY